MFSPEACFQHSVCATEVSSEASANAKGEKVIDIERRMKT